MIEPVSKRIPNGIESKYFEVKYRPGKESKKIRIYKFSVVLY